MERAHRQSTRLLSALLCVIGLALLASTLVHGGGPLATGVVLGALLAGLGAGRLLLSGAGRRDRA